MKASEQQALIPQEATPDTLIDLIGKTQQVTKAAAVVLKACRTVMDTHTKKEHIDKWGGIHAITEAASTPSPKQCTTARTSRSASLTRDWPWRTCARSHPRHGR